MKEAHEDGYFGNTKGGNNSINHVLVKSVQVAIAMCHGCLAIEIMNGPMRSPSIGN